MFIKRRKQAGFTLIELLITLTIIGVLSAIALPAYLNSIRVSNRVAAMVTMQNAAQFMERYYSINYNYEGVLTDIPIELTRSPDSGTTQYNISVAVTGTSSQAYTVTATPIAGTTQASDGVLKLTSTGNRTWDSNNNGTIDASEKCWNNGC